MARTSGPTLIVGVGASAGGLAAFRQLLSCLPDDGGMAFLLVQHMDPEHKSALAELLASSTRMRLVDAEQGTELEADRVYIVQADTALAVRGGRIALSEPVVHRGVRLPVDHLFRSLAHDCGERAVGIVLSGAGSDGQSGIRAIRRGGGLTIAQEPASCAQPGMPQAAIDTGMVDLVLDIADIPGALARFAGLPPGARAGDPVADETGQRDGAAASAGLGEDAIDRLAALLRAEADFDLHVYKPGTVERRVTRRMTLCGCASMGEYFERVRDNPAEQHALVRDLLISVTDFFRDADAFAALRELVVEPLVSAAAFGATLRVWVPGCATGEEAYSIAIEMLDAIEAQDKQVSLQVFATDVDQDGLDFARAAIYPPSIAGRMSERRLQRYFTPVPQKGYQVAPRLRDVVSFASHDLTRDPPFSRMNLVTCRNLLIYLRAAAQQRVLEVLHFALRGDGYLFLGSSEATNSKRELFTTVSKTWRIYRKHGTSAAIAMPFGRKTLGGGIRTGVLADRERVAAASSRAVAADAMARRAVLDRWVPPTIVVAQDGAVLFMHGELRPYLQFPQGADPRLDLASLVTPELATRTRAALYKCRRDGATVVALSSPDGARERRVRITAKPAFELGDQVVMLTFEDVDAVVAASSATADAPGQDALIEQLESELRATREDLRSTVEELEISNDELRASNDASMSMNEELQSANEELEASAEELRSLNEELTTVNAQLRDKVEQLERAHNDLNNFFSSTKIATLFLDEALHIVRFTPAAAELLGLQDADIGRCVGDIARELLQNDLASDARAVLERLSPRSLELRTQSGAWITREVLPYQTEGRRIEGVVVTFADVTALKTATERLSVREHQQATIAGLGLHALREPDLQVFLDRVIRDVQRTLGTDYCKVLELQPGGQSFLLRAGVGWREGIVGSARVGAGLDSQAGFTVQSAQPVIVDDLATERRFSGPPLLVEHGVVSGMSCVIRDGEAYGVIGAHTRQRREFSREDANFLQAVASVVGSAIGRQLARQRLALEGDVARALVGPATVDDVVVRVLRCFEADLGTCVGELWWPGEDGLSCRCFLVDDPGDDEIAERLGGAYTRTAGAGLVGQVFRSGRALWCSDVGEPQLFPRRDVAEAFGLRSGVAFPIVAGGRPLGVMTVFSRRRLFANEVSLRSLEGLGRSIGEFFQRMDVERKVRRLAAITESSRDGIVSYDFDGRVTEWLGDAPALFGYTAADMVGEPMARIVPPERMAELRARIEAVRRGEPVAPMETVRIRKDGSHVEVSVSSSPVKDETGVIVGVASTDRDVTARKATERRLLEADRQKDEFLAMLGHELRNPLGAIRSATELLRSACDGDDQVEQAHAVLDRQSSHMAALLDGLLDVSRIIRGKIRLERDVVDLAALCRQLAADASKRAGARDLEFIADIASGAIRVEGDRVRITQVVDNLLSNAIKFTREGGRVTLRLRREHDQAVLSVSDTGVGIAPDLLHAIFDVFSQSDQSLDRSQGGLGLGLALAKSLVELHDGTIEARSEGPDCGAQFTVRLPTTRRRAVLASNQTETDQPMRVLLIEDNEDSAEMMRVVLEMAGHHVSVANRGAAGVELAREVRPDVIMCDIGLPGGMSGFDVARALRSDPGTHGIRLVALTGYGRPQDKDEATAAGFDVHLTKPVGLATIKQVLLELSDA